MAAAASPPWKLYQNPHYNSHHDSPHQLQAYERPTSPPSAPPSEPAMDDLALARAEIELLRSEIGELRAQLEIERRMRQDAESLAKAIAQELAEESRARDEAEAEADRCREAASRAFMEAEEDRRMLKLAEAWREERVQMKLAEAAIVLEERLREIAENVIPKNVDVDYIPTVACAGTARGRVGRDKQAREAENPHIKRGIKGFVEFSRASKARSPGSARDRERAGGNLECQKAQLKVLMKQRNAADLSVVTDTQSIAIS
ncbi:hypothetical protein HPP92_016951 [Vanilla planifolia]|uniref:Uncharacterized protein n=1 Tax=Vanilla planifolia TaxID=51239 RepID=A0A835UTV3_VANPL|nr:hypothetical protein HPP92_016951 [Vanilla planifolia]